MSALENFFVPDVDHETKWQGEKRKNRMIE